MVVQQHVLNWLYSVLTSEYHDVNRTYNDVASAIHNFPSLAPRTDVHTFDNGVSALLLHLSGTIPVVFRGTAYRFPVSIWVPHAYPREPPLAYVTPNESMIVRPGQHVDPQGRVYHPYLAAWPEFWDKSSIVDLLAILRDIFSKEPPVVARQQAPPTQSPSHAAPTPPPVPPHPSAAASPASRIPLQSPNHGDRPPPPPPKGDQASPHPGGPPLPPLPPDLSRHSSQQSPYSASPVQGQSSVPSRYERAPPLPHQQGHQPPPQVYQQPPPGPPQAALPHALPQHQAPIQYQQGPPQGGPPPTQFQQHDPRRLSMMAPANPHPAGPPGPPQGPGPAGYGGPPPNWQQQHQQPPPPQQHQQPPMLVQPQHRPPPPPDIMDEPLTLALPSSTSLPAAPPIPPNPEKDALLRQLASTLYTLRQHARHQNETSLAGLSAQKNAMLAALQNLQNDSAALNPISAMLASNTNVLQASIQEADIVINNSKTQKVPAIDDLLVAPTVVGNQLYDLVAEERALGDAIFVLGRAVERGNMSPAVFAKTTRSLAREWYLKKALVRKIGRGMGLVG